MTATDGAKDARDGCGESAGGCDQSVDLGFKRFERGKRATDFIMIVRRSTNFVSVVAIFVIAVFV